MGVSMSDNCEEIRNRNKETFHAEAREKIKGDDWDTYLKKILADEFIIRRSNPAVADQNREAMIDWIRSHPVVPRDLLEHTVVTWCTETLGIVTCSVDMRDSEGKLHRYQNIKVFKKESDGNWQCLYW